MRLGIVSDTFLRTVLYHLFQHKVKPRIVDPGIELSIGKGPGSAFPELNIAAGIQRTSVEEFFSFSRTGLSVCALFDDNGFQSCPGKYQSGKDPRRSESDDDRPAITGNGRNDILLLFIDLCPVFPYQILLPAAQ